MNRLDHPVTIVTVVHLSCYSLREGRERGEREEGE